MNRGSSIVTANRTGNNRGGGTGPDLPRIIVWQITGRSGAGHEGSPQGSTSRAQEPLNLSESMLVIDSIARTAKPIVVFTGEYILARVNRLPDILEYGRALGLKMIVEVLPEELTDDILTEYSHFGERIFRVKITNALSQHPETRIEISPYFKELEDCLDRMERRGYETHLVYTAVDPDIRSLALLHDYAIRRSARGLYCHLRFDLGGRSRSQREREVDDFINKFATMKEYSPSSMIISPQCVKFSHTSRKSPMSGGRRGEDRLEWEYSCVSGKSFAYIDSCGIVQLCGGNPGKGISLRESGYDFRKIWSHAPAFTGKRSSCSHCLHGYHSLSPSDDTAQAGRPAARQPSPI